MILISIFALFISIIAAIAAIRANVLSHNSNDIAATANKIAHKSNLLSHGASVSARQTSFQLENVSSKMLSLERYSEAFGDFVTQIDLKYRKIPYKFDDPNIVQSLSDEETKVLQKGAEGALLDYRTYTTRVNICRIQWSEETVELIIKAGILANRLNGCLSIMETAPLEVHEEFWKNKRMNVCQHCQNFMQLRMAFDDESQKVIEAMLEELAAARKTSAAVNVISPEFSKLEEQPEA